MPKKYLTKKERSARTKKVLIIVSCSLIVLAALLIVLGITLGNKADEEKRIREEEEKASYEYLRANMEKNYREDPWDGKDAESVSKKEGALWALFEALMCIEDDGMRTGSKGVQYDTSSGNVLCADLSSFKEPALRSAAEKMLSAYSSFKGLTFRTGTLEQLKSEGKIDTAGPDVYTEGCLLRIGAPAYDGEARIWETDVFFYYDNRRGRGATVRSFRTEDKDYVVNEMNYEVKDDRSDDGIWISWIDQTMIT